MSDWWAGVSDFQANLQGVRERKNAGAVEGIQMALLNVENVSNRQVPHEDGDLERDSTTSVEATAHGARGALSYGNRADTKDYAVVQHEDMSLHHDSGRNAKFLENAFNSTRAESAEIAAARVKAKMGT